MEGKLEAPKHLARTVHDLYLEPKYEEFKLRTIWSLSNAFTSAFKELDPIPQFKATAKVNSWWRGSNNRFDQLGGSGRIGCSNRKRCRLPVRFVRILRM